MIGDVTTPERMDVISSGGYAFGYIGSCIPFIIALAFYALGLFGYMNMKLSIALAFIVAGLWWLLVTLPLLRRYEQKNYVGQSGKAFGESMKRIGNTVAHMYRDHKNVLFFLIAFFFYIDGVYTIIDEAVAIGSALNLGDMGLLVVLLLTQVVAFAFATLFGKLSEKYDSIKLISVFILGDFAVAIFALFMHSLWQFGIMAFMVGMFQGAIQALSRSYFASIIPQDSSGEYFGIYDICGKGASFVGTMLIGITVSLTGSVNIAVSTLAVLFVLGFIFLQLSVKTSKADAKQK